MLQVIGNFATASLLYTLWLQIATLTSEKASFVGLQLVIRVPKHAFYALRVSFKA